MYTIKKLCFLSIFLIVTVSNLHSEDKIYIDNDELNMSQDTFRIHTGHNVWIETNAVFRDSTGLFTFESNITRSLNDKIPNLAYEKSWKCPYCYQYWPVGSPCKNPNCPSKYK